MFGFDDRTRALLAAIQRAGNVAGAARALGIDPSNARRHLRTAEARAGARLVEARHGGRGGRNARLTGAARAWLGERRARGVALAYDEEEGVTPVVLGRRTIFAAGRCPEGPVAVTVDPTAVALARRLPAGTSVRNHLRAVVERIVPLSEGTYEVRLVAGALRLRAHLTRGGLRDLRLREGSRVVAGVKATAVRLG